MVSPLQGILDLCSSATYLYSSATYGWDQCQRGPDRNQFIFPHVATVNRQPTRTNDGFQCGMLLTNPVQYGSSTAHLTIGKFNRNLVRLSQIPGNREQFDSKDVNQGGNPKIGTKRCE